MTVDSAKYQRGQEEDCVLLGIALQRGSQLLSDNNRTWGYQNITEQELSLKNQLEHSATPQHLAHSCLSTDTSGLIVKWSRVGRNPCAKKLLYAM